MKRLVSGSSRGILATLLTAGLVLSGCAKGDGEPGGDSVQTSMTSAASEASRERDTDAPGVAEVAEASNDRVAAAGFGDVDTLLALGIVPVTVAPWGQPGDTGEKGVGPWALEALGDNDPAKIMGTASGFTGQIVEQIAATDPTKIIAVNAAVDEQARKDLEAIAPLATHSDEYQDWSVPWQEQIRDIAAAVGMSDRGEELIEESEQSFTDFASAHPELSDKTVAVVFPLKGELRLYTEDHNRGRFISKLGFEMPEELTEQAGDSFYVAISPENYNTLSAADYVYVLDYQGGVDQLKNDPAFSSIAAVREGRVRYIDEDTANAMSMMNPLTIPWAIDRIEEQL